MAFPPTWCRAKRSRLLSWTTPGGSQRLFLASRLGCLWFWFWQGDFWLKCVFCFDMFLPWDEYHQWKQTCLKKRSVLLLPSFHPCHSNPSRVGNSNGFLGDGFFNSTHVSEWCVLGPFTKLGKERWDQVEASFKWWGGKLNDQRDSWIWRWSWLFMYQVHGEFPDPMFYFGKKSERFFSKSRSNISKIVKNLFRFPIIAFHQGEGCVFLQKMWSMNVALQPWDAPTGSWWWRLKIASWKGQLIDALRVYLNYPGRNF